jgi:hypothetical protein
MGRTTLCVCVHTKQNNNNVPVLDKNVTNKAQENFIMVNKMNNTQNEGRIVHKQEVEGSLFGVCFWWWMMGTTTTDTTTQRKDTTRTCRRLRNDRQTVEMSTSTLLSLHKNTDTGKCTHTHTHTHTAFWGAHGQTSTQLGVPILSRSTRHRLF